MASEATLVRVIVRRHARPPAPSGAERFDERLSVPWWWWPSAVVVVAPVVVSVRLGHPGVPAWVPAVVVAALLATGLVRLGRVRVTVVDGVDTADRVDTTDRVDGAGSGSPDDGADGLLLRVGPAVLPVRFVAEVTVLRAGDKQRALGPELDPDAFVVHRPWIGPAVRVRLDDPRDPTPYWVFSVRRPEALAEHLGTTRPRC
jgi:hypothetical protein